MKKEFVPYELALRLKQLGFDEPCFCFYSKIYGLIPTLPTYKVNEVAGEVILPLYQQAFRWFREKHNMLSTIYSNASGFLYEWSDTIGGTHRGWSDCEGPNDGGVWDTYEEAELACLTKLIEIVEQK
jgi:hypothetical protein